MTAEDRLRDIQRRLDKMPTSGGVGLMFGCTLLGSLVTLYAIYGAWWMGWLVVN